MGCKWADSGNYSGICEEPQIKEKVRWTSLKYILKLENVEKREPSYTAGGIIN